MKPLYDKNISLLSYVQPLNLLTKVVYKVNTDKSKHTGRWLRNELITLGPTYIKIGQIMSTRTDIFPEYITNELDDLKNDVPSLNIHEIITVFENDFNESPSNIFKEFESTPIGSASIAQVHLATLVNGKQVVVKVQKPNIRHNMLHDIQIMNNILSLMDTIIPVKQVKDIRTVVRDTSANLLDETDFIMEYRNMKRFYAMFNKNDNVIIPRVYSKISSRNVIVMEYLPGKNIKDIAKEDNLELANSIMSEFIEGVIKYGYLHADPHSGNIAFTKDNKIILYDFGTIAKYDASFRRAFKQLFQNFLKRDVEMIMMSLLEHEILILYSGHLSIHELDPYEYVVLHNLITYLIEYTVDANINKLTQKINNDQFIKPNNIPFVFNSKMVLLFKSFATLEGICKTLSNDFSYESMLNLMIMKLIDFDFINDRIKYDIDSLTNPKQSNNLIESKLLLLQNKKYTEPNSIQLFVFLCLILYKSFFYL